jgi:hypothetical protein
VTDGAPHGHEDHEHGGHEHLSHVPDAARPAVYAARAAVAFEPPMRADQLESVVTRFLEALSAELARAGCTLVGHIKGTVEARGQGDLAFHATTLGARPAVTGGLAGLAADAVLTVNVIVFGVDEQALPGMVQDAWSRASGAATTWPAEGTAARQQHIPGPSSA